MITVENLSKRYAATTAVDDLSFEVSSREILGFLGPNGAGKSTTLRILTGFLAAGSGRVEVDGHDVALHPEAVKQVVGYMPENVPLYGEMRVDEYLRYRAALKNVPRKKRDRAVGEAVERCRIGDVRRRIIGQLSKGYRQRVGMADALVGDPKILVLDEPTIGLDPNQIRQVRELIKELGRERTVILSSHILPEVEAVCSRVLILAGGKLRGQGHPDELRAKLQAKTGSVVVELLDTPPAADAPALLGAIEGVDRVVEVQRTGLGTVRITLAAGEDLAVRERVFETAGEKGLRLVGLSADAASLEDVFVQITTQDVSKDTDEPEPEEGGAGKGGES